MKQKKLVSLICKEVAKTLLKMAESGDASINKSHQIRKITPISKDNPFTFRVATSNKNWEDIKGDVLTIPSLIKLLATIAAQNEDTICNIIQKIDKKTLANKRKDKVDDRLPYQL